MKKQEVEMNRKIILTAIGAMLFLLGCTVVQQPEMRASAPATPPATLAQTPVGEQVTVDERLLTANAKFGFNLFQQLRQQEGNKNIFISPTSVAIALDLLLQGADGTTQQAMFKALELQGMSLEDLNSANRALHQALEKADPGVQLAIANSLWTREGISFKPEFLQTNQQYYDAKVSTLDFTRPEAPNTINTWVSENTNGKIKRMVDQINADAILFLLNAIYFKGDWTQPFDPEQTREKPFFLSDGTQKQHSLMSQGGEYRYSETEQFQAVSLPYGKERHLSMYIFLPRPNSSLSAFSQQLTAENWQTWMQQFSRRDGRIEIPRFKLEYEASLNDVLKALGMETIFDPTTANFSKMTDASVVVDEVKHKTFVEVNEEGTEAAAVTSIGVRVTSVPPPPFQMTVDRPFFFAIRDERTGTVLFMGSIVEPQ
jgi:serine protease inhibitor